MRATAVGGELTLHPDVLPQFKQAIEFQSKWVKPEEYRIGGGTVLAMRCQHPSHC